MVFYEAHHLEARREGEAPLNQKPAEKKNQKKSSSWYLSGFLYDLILEPLLKSIRKKVAAYVIQHDLFPVLDLCCGTGRQFSHLGAGEGRQAFGLDIDFRMIRYASSKAPSVSFVCSDATRTPFRNAVFKGVIISYALHEKRYPSRLQILAEAERLLATDGRVVIVDFEKPWSRRSLRASLWTTVIEWLAGKEHFRSNRDFLKRRGLTGLMEESSFTQIDQMGIELGNTRIIVAGLEKTASLPFSEEMIIEKRQKD